MNGKMFAAQCESPLGHLSLAADDEGIRRLSFHDEPPSFNSHSTSNALLDQCVGELMDYFRGVRRSFSVPVSPQGTPFEQQVWDSLLSIDYATTCSYLDIANRLKNPGAIRAVGRANGANPIAIVIPCHRVIGSNGSLTGYAGGLWRKRWLLDHEARVAGTSLF